MSATDDTPEMPTEHVAVDVARKAKIIAMLVGILRAEFRTEPIAAFAVVHELHGQMARQLNIARVDTTGGAHDGEVVTFQS